jgi:hypothetical protein
MRRRLARSVAFAVALSLSTTTLVLGAHAGYEDSTRQGIYGYINQSLTGTINNGIHAAWINLCESGCPRWVQTGTIQGCWMGGCAKSTLSAYRENIDACGAYYAANVGAPGASDYLYYLSRVGSAFDLTCTNGTHRTAYTYEFKKGSITSVPFYYGNLSSSTGSAFAKSEYVGDATYTTDWFGCDTLATCNTSSYGLRLRTNGSWALWTATSTPVHGNPPYLHTYNSYWSFKTCASSC